MTKQEVSIEKMKHKDIVCFISCYDGWWIVESMSLIKDIKNCYVALSPHHLPVSDSTIAEADSLEELLLHIAVSHPDMKLMCADMKVGNSVEEFSRVLWRNLMRDDSVTLYEMIA